MPTPIALISAADFKDPAGNSAACSASPSVNPPMPAPTMMMSSMSPPGMLFVSGCGDETRLVRPTVNLDACRQSGLAGFDKAHPHRVAWPSDLTRQPFGAGPRPEALVVVGGVGVLEVAMRAPAVLIFGAGKFGAAARLRAAGEAARKIRAFAVAKRGQDIAAADLVAEEMRRGRHDDRIGRVWRPSSRRRGNESRRCRGSDGSPHR